MKRTVARQLALVNWRGVFYERYQLDLGVTALEGTNGAGKTTVMVAAYVVLLPDQRYLHFEPLAEGGVKADDRGIWGRLGTGDAYSALDFNLGTGERLVAGVHFERRGQDRGELNPFLIQGLPAEASLQSLLLERRNELDAVPPPDRLAQLAAVAGGRLTWCDSVGSYLRALFDAGVAPMPMSLESERVKLNELLRTSMMGGVSKKLGDGLRSFLLRPEEGLGRNLKRIRANLDDCRRTRATVEESRKLEEEIHQILEAGARMFAAAVEGARRYADERQSQADDAERKRNEAKSRSESLEADLEEAKGSLRQREAENEASRQKLGDAQERAQHVRRANEIWTKRRSEAERLTELDAAVSRARHAHDAATNRLESAEARVRERERDHQEAAKGMADIQKGLERLHAHASRYRTVQAAMARIRLALPDLEITDERVHSVLQHCLGKVDATSRELVRAQGALDTAEMQEEAFRTVHRALEFIMSRRVPDAEAHGAALAALVELRALDSVAAALEALRDDKRRADELAERQVVVRKRAAALATPRTPLGTSQQLKAERDTCSRAFEQERDAWFEAVETRRTLKREVTEL